MNITSRSITELNERMNLIASSRYSTEYAKQLLTNHNQKYDEIRDFLTCTQQHNNCPLRISDLKKNIQARDSDSVAKNCS